MWCELIRSMRVEDGRRWVLDHELVLHDSVMSGEMTVKDVLTVAREHFSNLQAGSRLD